MNRDEIIKNKADLVRADLVKANLSMADLSEANLSEANLRGADLVKANLSKANLSMADLVKANLSKANLSMADLSEADLRGANLRGADLRGADLRGADLRGANLRGADLRGCARFDIYEVAHEFCNVIFIDSNMIYFKIDDVVYAVFYDCDRTKTALANAKKIHETDPGAQIMLFTEDVPEFTEKDCQEIDINEN